jgi:hypothetical protein
MPTTPAISKNVVPDIILFQTLNSLLEYLKSDWGKQSDKTKSVLYKMINDVPAMANYNWYEQAVKVLVGNGEIDTPRVLEVRRSFDSSRLNVPTIHIRLTSENKSNDSIGQGQQGGEEDYLWNDEENSYQPIYTKRYKSKYSLLVTSDNENEVILIYNFIKMFLNASIDHFEFLGIENISFSGNDLTQNTETAYRYFMRVLNMDFEYELATPTIFKNKFVSDIIFNDINVL